MSSILLTWNPKYKDWENIFAEVQESNRSGSRTVPWDVGGSRKPGEGDRAFLMRVGNSQGVVGAGWIVSDTKEAPHWRPEKAAEGKTYRYVEVVFEHLHEFPLIPLDALRKPPFADVNWTPRRSGRQLPERVEAELEQQWATAISTASGVRNIDEQLDLAESSADPFDPTSLHDARERIVSSIVVRRGGKLFRDSLLAAYGQRCAVTGCDAVEALEAAHITPYLGPRTDRVTNGLLLRADIHTLFDLNLLTVEPVTWRVLISSRLHQTCYQAFADQRIRLPADEAEQPNITSLQRRLIDFHAEERDRT